MIKLEGQKVVILGGTSGLGFAVAQAVTNEGAQAIVASATQSRVAAAVAALPGAEGHVLDVTDEAKVKALFTKIGAFDHLVYTAGDWLLVGDFLDTDLAEARKAFDVRFWGALAAIKHGSPHIRKGGSVVLTTGIASARPFKGWTVPASILGAMEALTRALAVELAPLRVNTVSPGVVKTAMWDAMPEADREGLYAGVGEKLLVGRVGEAAEVAQTYIYLMRQEFSSGQVVTVDGGGVLV